MTTYQDIRLGLSAYLLTSSEIAAVIGTRVFPSELPQGEKRTSIVFARATGQGDHHMQGPSGLSRPRFQIDAWSMTTNGSAILANLIKARIDGFRGQMPYGTESPQAYIDVLGVFYTDERDGFDADSALYRVSRDYFVWYRDFINP